MCQITIVYGRITRFNLPDTLLIA